MRTKNLEIIYEIWLSWKIIVLLPNNHASREHNSRIIGKSMYVNKNINKAFVNLDRVQYPLCSNIQLPTRKTW